MIGIGSAGLNISGLAVAASDSKTLIKGVENSAVATADETTQSGTEAKNGEATRVNMGGGGPGEAESGSSESAHIQQLRQQMKELQEQLAEQQKQLQEVMASKMEEDAKVVAVLSAQTAVNGTSAALAQVTAALLSALNDTGSSSAGSAVDTTA